jgi:hypothetical protein
VVNLESVLPMMAKFLGYTPEQGDQIRRALENRLRDAKALIYGGQLTDGTDFPGLKALDETVRELSKQVEKLSAAMPAVAEGTVSNLDTKNSDGGCPN